MDSDTAFKTLAPGSQQYLYQCPLSLFTVFPKTGEQSHFPVKLAEGMSMSQCWSLSPYLPFRTTPNRLSIALSS